jgi:anti-anti-sigma regulatory factor
MAGTPSPPPVSLDESTFERLLRQLDSPARDASRQMIIDLEQVRFVDPYGMVGLLVLACFLRQRSCEPVLMLPRSHEVMRYSIVWTFSPCRALMCHRSDDALA